MAKMESRPTRWAAACQAARFALGNLDAAWGEFEAAFMDLADLQGEYGDWQNNLPENLAQSALAEKLEEVVSLDLEPDLDLPSLGEMLDAAESVELPQGFGRD